MTPAQRRALVLVAVSQLFALGVWFSASAVAPQLEHEWQLGEGGSAALTLAVQIGFVAGALLSATLNVADLFPARAVFGASAVAAALANLGLLGVGPGSSARAYLLRFATGLFLAGVYPTGLKVMAGWFREGRGMAMGLMVGALTVGSASPHLVRGIGLDWPGVVAAASVLTLLSALMMARVGDGPYDAMSPRFRWRQVADAMSTRGTRLATFGYLGHMWELYALWTWTAAYLAASAAAAGGGYPSIPVLTFLVIAAGGVGAWVAGRMADRLGRSLVAGGAMAISGACCLASAVVFGLPAWVVIPVMLVWGVTVVADSAQFSAMVTETSTPETRGTALTMQTALGFLLTMVTIWAVPRIAELMSWRWAFVGLAIGPGLGVLAMTRFRRVIETAYP
ncbi:MAG TPA: MFS transporter [Acidimicrobiia bacterium]